VWLDALVNYLTVGGYPDPGYIWPATAHIVGKDILRFHAMFWPAFLMAAGLDPPEQVISHSHWTMGKLKMSKSRGNVVDPYSVLSTYGVDAVRYFLLKDGRLHQDGDYSEQRISTLLDGDLADTLGNLLSRVTSSRLYPNGEFPKGISHHLREEDRKRILKDHGGLLASMRSLPERVSECYDNCEFGKGISAVMDCLHQNNAFLEDYKPWLLVKDIQQHHLLLSVLLLSLECLRMSAIHLWPVLPSSSEKMASKLRLQFPFCAEDLKCQFRNDFSQLSSIADVDLTSKCVLFQKTNH
jgi:methionyl-tRNA synthetase